MRNLRNFLRQKRHHKIRKKIFGTKERYRLCVFRSLKHIYASIIDDESNKVILTVSTLSKDFKDKHDGSSCDNSKAAELLGSLLAKKCIEKDIKKIVFDRSGYLYHGRIKKIADTVRKEGLSF
ncbi:MAG: 50S ribosomal protein L18 [Candidatus Firestonebacteria bacterium]